MKRLTLWTSLLALPLLILLFLQWPLRELVHAYSQQANDAGQILFALYVAVAITATSVAQAHLAVGMPGQARAGGWRSLVAAVCVLPWSLFMLWSIGPSVLHSTAALEHFAETRTPGYFVIKMAAAFLLLMAVGHAIAIIFGSIRQRP
jgi:hypothetical protein